MNLDHPSGTIHLLPEHIVDQIKAGEVIERPATLLKELLENSIDAGATKVHIHILNNGLDLILVEDNGHGINHKDLPLAFCRHATSKINIFEDLYQLSSYGFRGEALASMASVSKMTCTSSLGNNQESTIQYHGGEMISHRQEETKSDLKGTKIFVKDLFFNTPVRMKFLKSQTSEKNQLKKILNAFILTHPEVEFTIKWDDADKELYPKIQDQKMTTRVKQLFDKKKQDLELIDFNSEYDGVKVRIILSHNSAKGHAGKFHYLFVNNRYVQDPQIHRIILNSAQKMWPMGLTGSYIAYIDLNPDQLDVNVHPNKTVIKLFQASKVFSLISGSIKKHLPQSYQQNNSISSAHDHHQNTNFDLKEKEVNFKDISYREQDFSAEDNLDQYFNRLDNITIPEEKSEYSHIILLSDSSVLLSKSEDKIYLFDVQKLLHFHIEYLFSNKTQQASVPLLVSSPLKTRVKLDENQLKNFYQHGFEIDYLSENSLVLRSFPKSLSDLPYTQILDGFMQEEKNFKSEDLRLPKDFYINYQLSTRHLNQLLESYPLPKLMEQRICKLINKKELLRLL